MVTSNSFDGRCNWNGWRSIGEVKGKKYAFRRYFTTQFKMRSKTNGAFLDFDCGDNSAEIVNNYDWFQELSFLDFIEMRQTYSY